MGRAYEVRKASIQKTGAAKGKVYTTFAKEIYLAAKKGSPNPEANVTLKRLIDKAKKNQVPSDIITRAIGAKNNVDVDFYEHRLKRGDIILMCTDGLSNMVEDEELFHIVQGGRDIVEAGTALVDAAKENGGTDNIGVVLMEPFTDEVSIC